MPVGKGTAVRKIGSAVEAGKVFEATQEEFWVGVENLNRVISRKLLTTA